MAVAQSALQDKGTTTGNCETFFEPSNVLTPQSGIASRPTISAEDRSIIIDCGGLLWLMMSNDSLTLGDEKTIRKSHNKTVTMTTNGLAESLEEVAC